MRFKRHPQSRSRILLKTYLKGTDDDPVDPVRRVYHARLLARY